MSYKIPWLKLGSQGNKFQYRMVRNTGIYKLAVITKSVTICFVYI